MTGSWLVIGAWSLVMSVLFASAVAVAAAEGPPTLSFGLHTADDDLALAEVAEDGVERAESLLEAGEVPAKLLGGLEHGVSDLVLRLLGAGGEVVQGGVEPLDLFLLQPRHALLDIVDPLGIPALQVASHAILGSAAITSVTIPEATRHLALAVDIASKNELPPPQEAFDIEMLSIAHSTFAIALVLDGRPDAALAELEASVARGRSIDHLHTLGSCLYNATVTSYFLDDPVAAERWADETLEAIEGRGFHTPESGARVFRGWARVLQGDSAGVGEVEQGLEQAASSGYSHRRQCPRPCYRH